MDKIQSVVGVLEYGNEILRYQPDTRNVILMIVYQVEVLTQNLRRLTLLLGLESKPP